MNQKIIIIVGIAGIAVGIAGTAVLAASLISSQAILKTASEPQPPLTFVLEGEVQSVNSADRSFRLKTINLFPPTAGLGSITGDGGTFLYYTMYASARAIMHHARIYLAEGAIDRYEAGDVVRLSRDLRELVPGTRIRVFGSRVARGTENSQALVYQAEIIIATSFVR